MKQVTALLLLASAGAWMYSRSAEAANAYAVFQPVYSPFAPESSIDYEAAANSDGIITYYDPYGGSITPEPWFDEASGEVIQLPPTDSVESLPPGDGGYQSIAGAGMARFTADKIPAEYADAIRAAEIANGIPFNMLASLLWKESRFNPEAYNAKSNASGIAQIVPRWHPTVNVWDAGASIDYAAKYLASLYRMFDAWPYALAAYNWGPGNLKKYGIAKAPAETRDYYSTILASVGMSTVVV